MQHIVSTIFAFIYSQLLLTFIGFVYGLRMVNLWPFFSFYFNHMSCFACVIAFVVSNSVLCIAVTVFKCKKVGPCTNFKCGFLNFPQVRNSGKAELTEIIKSICFYSTAFIYFIMTVRYHLWRRLLSLFLYFTSKLKPAHKTLFDNLTADKYNWASNNLFALFYMGVNVDLQINLLRPLSHESCTHAVSKENMLMQFKRLENTILKDIFYRHILQNRIFHDMHPLQNGRDA